MRRYLLTATHFARTALNYPAHLDYRETRLMRKAMFHPPINHVVAVAVALGAILAHASGQVPCQYEVTLFYGPDDCRKSGHPPVPVTRAINSAGAIAGYYTDCGFPVQFGFFWSADSGLQTLAGLDGYGDARAYDLIDADFIVGTMRFGKQEHGILWNQGVPIDIGIPLGGNSTAALAVNSKGQITGYWGNTVQGGVGTFSSGTEL